jgi:hypothetical protein
VASVQVCQFPINAMPQNPATFAACKELSVFPFTDSMEGKTG